MSQNTLSVGDSEMYYIKRILPGAILWFIFLTVMLIIRLVIMAYDGELPTKPAIFAWRIAQVLAFMTVLSFAASACMEWSAKRKGRRK